MGYETGVVSEKTKASIRRRKGRWTDETSIFKMGSEFLWGSSVETLRKKPRRFYSLNEVGDTDGRERDEET